VDRLFAKRIDQNFTADFEWQVMKQIIFVLSKNALVLYLMQRDRSGITRSLVDKLLEQMFFPFPSSSFFVVI
jgi:hypothetical protein